MAFYGRANRILVEQELGNGVIGDSQISDCDLNGLRAGNADWVHADLRDSPVNDAEFSNVRFSGSTFYRDSFMRTKFSASSFTGVVIDGLTLIKTQWIASRFTNSIIKNSCLQRAVLRGIRASALSMVDFEALNIEMENCLFAHSRFTINYDGGMNGFSGGVIRNCLFYNCYFEGFPLRGSEIHGSVFAACGGEIGDEMDCENVAGLGVKGVPCSMPLCSAADAETLLARFAEAA
jgi:uncharacterized protein YjbI with pentapeptide repeats